MHVCMSTHLEKEGNQSTISYFTCFPLPRLLSYLPTYIPKYIHRLFFFSLSTFDCFFWFNTFLPLPGHCTHTHIHTHTHTYLHTHTDPYIHTHICIYTHIHTSLLPTVYRHHEHHHLSILCAPATLEDILILPHYRYITNQSVSYSLGILFKFEISKNNGRGPRALFAMFATSSSLR